MVNPLDRRMEALRALQAATRRQFPAYSPYRPSGLMGEVGTGMADLKKAEMNAAERIMNDPIMARRNPDRYLAELRKITAGTSEDTSGGILGSIGKVAGEGLKGVVYALSRPLAVVASAGKEIADIGQGDASFADFIRQSLDPTTTVSKYLPKTGNKWLDGAIGLVGDIALDPLTYITFGASAFAGRGGRLALSAKAAEAANIAKMPSLAAKVSDGSIARLGEWALTNAEREVLGVRKGLSWTFGSRGMIGKEGTALAALSGATAQVFGKNFAKGRALIGDTQLVRPLQKLTAPASVKRAGLVGYGRVKDDPQVTNAIAQLAAYSAAPRSNAAGRLVQQKFGSRGQELVKNISDYESRTGRRIFEVREGIRPAADAEEQGLVDGMVTFLSELRDEANKTTADFAGRRGATARQIAFRENYIPRSLTPEARDWLAKEMARDPNFSGAGAIRDMLDMSATEFKTGPTPLQARTLNKDDTFLGVQLKTDVGDGIGKVGDPDYVPGSATMAEINDVSQNKLGFKWFEEDGAQYISNYLDAIITQTKRVAFTDRLFDYGNDVVRLYSTRLIPDQKLVRTLNGAIISFDQLTDNVLARFVGAVGTDVDDILAPRLEMANRILSSRPGEIFTPEEVVALREAIDDIISRIAEVDGVARGTSREVRDAYETLAAPLRARVAEIVDALDNNEHDRLVALVGLRELYQRIFPDAQSYPIDPRALAEDIIDGVAALRQAPKLAEFAMDEADKAAARAAGLEVPVPGGAVYATPEDARQAVANLEGALARQQAGMEARFGLEAVSEGLPAQAQASVARQTIGNLEGEIEDIAQQTEAGLADVAARRTEAERIIEEQRQMFGGDVGISGRAVSLPEAREGAANFNATRGKPYSPPPAQTMINPAFQADMARAYNRMPLGRPDASTKAGRAAIASYEALKRDIEEQFDYLTNTLGIKVEFVPDDPYPNPAEMFIDIQNNKRLRVWSGESDNPMLSYEENLKFRAVHDFFGHAAVGSRFDRNGEEMAFLHHIQMFSPEARGAAASELRGQNSYLITYGEFGPQKGYLMPEKYWGPNNDVVDAIEGLLTYGGHTVDLARKEPRPTSGYQVSLGGELERSIGADEINSVTDLVDGLLAPFLADPKAIAALRKKGQFFGTYYSGDSDLVYAEVSRNYATLDEAYEQAVRARQESILDWVAFDANEGGEIFTLDIMRQKEQAGKVLTDEELQARKIIEERVAQKQARKEALERAKAQQGAAGGGTGGVQGSQPGGVGGYQEVAGRQADDFRPDATDTQGRTGVERLGALPTSRLTQDQTDQILRDGARRLRELGVIDTKFPRTATGTRVNPLDKEAKNLRVSAARRTSLRREQIAEAQAMVDSVTPLGVARQEWDDTVGRIYNEDIGAIVRLFEERPPAGAAKEITTQWLFKAIRTLEAVNAPGLDLGPVERDVIGRLLTSMKGMEAQLALYERGRDFSADQLERTLRGELGSPKFVDNLLSGWQKIESLGVQMPPEVRDLMFQRVKSLEDPANRNALLKMYDSYTRFFKVTAMLTPGFIARNSYTAAFNNFVEGVTYRETAQGLRFATKLLRQGTDAALASVPQAERSLYEEALRVAYASGAGQTADDIMAPILAGKGAKWVNKQPVKMWSRLNEGAEVAARFSMALSSLKRGSSFDDALAKVTRYHFDYTDLSTLDEFARKFIPFWIFASRNIQLQLVNQVARPSIYRKYEALQRNFGVSEDDESIYPGWLARRNPLQFPGMAPGSVISPDLPQLDMAEQIRMFSDPMRLLSQFNPAVKLPIELMGGRQLYMNIPFKEDKVDVRGPLDYPAYLAGMLFGGGSGQRPDGSRFMSSRTAYAVPNAIPLLGTIQRLFPQAGGSEKYMDRQGSSVSSFFGLPYRKVSQQEQFNELLRRQFEIRNYLSNLTRTGQLVPKDQL